jgi:hypothetical protein
MIYRYSQDTYALYDDYGNRYLVFSDWDYWRVSRLIVGAAFLRTFSA